MLRAQCRPMARTRPPAMSDLSLLSGVERKLAIGDVWAAVDPTETSAAPNGNALDAGFSHYRNNCFGC
jgi:hypothetical protein